jgi:hypothetical protein
MLSAPRNGTSNVDLSAAGRYPLEYVAVQSGRCLHSLGGKHFFHAQVKEIKQQEMASTFDPEGL